MISSAANPLLKDVRRAIDRGTMTSHGWWIAESFHLLDEAIRSNCKVKAVLVAEAVQHTAETRVGRLPGIKLVVLPDTLFQKISATEHSQGVMALIDPPVWTFDRLFGACPLLVLLDGLQDPGNAGAVIRAAEAFGATGAIFLQGSVSPYNPKTLRASAGSLFRLPFLYGIDPEQARDALQQKGVGLYAAMPARPGTNLRPPAGVDLTAACGLIIGNESHGVSERLRSTARGITIPTTGVESLNAAVAAGVLLYEAQRQRSSPP